MVLAILVKLLIYSFYSYLSYNISIATYDLLIEEAWFFSDKNGLIPLYAYPTYFYFALSIPAIGWVLGVKPILKIIDNMQILYYTNKILDLQIPTNKIYIRSLKHILSLTAAKILGDKFESIIKNLKYQFIDKKIKEPTQQDKVEDNVEPNKNEKISIEKLKLGFIEIKNIINTFLTEKQKRLIKIVTNIIDTNVMISLSFIDTAIISYMFVQLHEAKSEKRKLKIKDKSIILFEGLILYLKAMPKIVGSLLYLDIFMVLIDILVFFGTIYVIIFNLTNLTLTQRIGLFIILQHSIKIIMHDIISYNIRLYFILKTFYKHLKEMEDLSVEGDIINLIKQVPFFKSYAKQLGLKKKDISKEMNTDLSSLFNINTDINDSISKVKNDSKNIFKKLKIEDEDEDEIEDEDEEQKQEEEQEKQKQEEEDKPIKEKQNQDQEQKENKLEFDFILDEEELDEDLEGIEDEDLDDDEEDEILEFIQNDKEINNKSSQSKYKQITPLDSLDFL